MIPSVWFTGHHGFIGRTLVSKIMSGRTSRLLLPTMSNEAYSLRSIPLVHFDFLVEEILAFRQNVILFVYIKVV
jgi:hypothetical protein